MIGTIRVDAGALPAPAQKILDPKGPPPLRQMAAKGIAPGLKPHEALAVVVLLAEAGDADPAIAAAANATLDKIPAPLLAGALTPALDPGVCDVLAQRYATDAVLMERLLTLPQLAPSSVASTSASLKRTSS